jgi:thiol-disulfide isomerase/thioredoxin
MNGKVNLSTFDGSHAFLFDAVISHDSLTKGRFISGVHYTNQWFGVADDNFELTPPTELVSADSSDSPFMFSLPNLDGDTLTQDDFTDGETIHLYNITGSWCPNCKDAALTLNEISSTYSGNSVKIVPIAFELSDDIEIARRSISRMQQDLGISEYTLFGGKATKLNTAAAFLYPNQIMAYPTIIITDKNGMIEEIFTGFYGPGTGSYHGELKSDIKAVIDRLIRK